MGECTMSRLRRQYPCFLVLGLYLACVLIADPRGDFPLNDDWSYARTAFAIGSGQGIKVDAWAAPSLVGQALYGGLLAAVFSPSFLLLRLSTLFLSCGAIVLLWALLVRTGFRRDFCCIAILAWAFNPLQFNLAFTYMTEIPFLFFAALAFYLYVRHLEEGRIPCLVLSAAALGYAYMIRQTALFFILALGCSVLLDPAKQRRQRALQGAVVAGASGIMIAGYYALMLAGGSATAAVHRKFELLAHLTAKQIIGNSYGLLFYLAFMLAPVWILLVPSLYRMGRSVRPTVRAGILAVWCVVVVAGLWWFHQQYVAGSYLPAVAYHSRMPFLLNVLYDTGLGPLTLEPAYYGTPPLPVYPRIWSGITAVVAIGAVLLGSLCVGSGTRLRQAVPFRNQRPLFVFAGLSLLLLAAFEILFSHVQEGGLFDRHILIVSFPLYLLLGMLSGESPAEPGRRSPSRLLIPSLALAALIAFCVAATHDYMEWNRIRWDLGRALLQRGIDPLAIAGGFEFNAWNNYDTFVARGHIERIHHWWYDRPDYVISMSPQDGYEIETRRTFYSWVHRRTARLFVLRKLRSHVSKASGFGNVADEKQEQLHVLEEIHHHTVRPEQKQL